MASIIQQTRDLLKRIKPQDILSGGIQAATGKPLDYYKPTSNNGQNFWSTPVASGLGIAQNKFETGTLPKVNLQQYTTKINAPVARFGAQLGAGFAENMLNLPQRVLESGGRLGVDVRNTMSGQTPSAPRLIGTAANVALPLLDIATLGGGMLLKNVGKQAIKQAGVQGVKQVIKTGITSGAKYGALFGGLSGLAEGNEATLKNFFSGLGVGVVTGGALGGVTSSIGAIRGLIKRTPAVESQLRDAAGRWTPGDKPVKPPKMPKAQWEFQKKFNEKYGRNPYTPVYPQDLDRAWKYEAEKKGMGLSVRDINKDTNPLSQPQTGGVGATYPKANEGLVAETMGQKQVPLVEPTTVQSSQIKSPLKEPALTGGGQQGIPNNVSSGGSIPPTDPVQKIIQALKEAKPIRAEQEAMYSKARSQRVARAAAMGGQVPGEQGYYAQLGQLKGELPKAQFEGIRNKLTTEDINSVFDKVEQTPYFSTFEKITAKTGLAKLLGKEGGVVPNKSELSLLNEIFPPEFIQAAMGNRTLLQKVLGAIGQVAAVPRSLMAGGFDMSYGLRQGIFSGYRHPKQWASAFKEQFKYFGSDKAVKELGESIKSDPIYPLAREAKIAFTDLGSGRLNPREEQFQSALAEKIPLVGKLVRASGRAYTGFANKYRFDMFKDLVAQAKKTGDFDNPKFLKDAGELVNTLTGRGNLGPFEKQAGVLSSTLFSPRLLASRLQLMNPQFYMKLAPTVRKRAVESLVAYIAGTATVLGAAKLAGADVGTDMTSSDFAKIKVGNTRIDIMGGFSQPMVLLARLLTNKVTSSTSGKVMTLGEGYKPMTRFDMIQRFFESKEAPIVSFITSAIKGQTAIGEPFNLPSEVISRMIPMFISDLTDLYKDGGLSSIPLGVPAFFGAGSQTYGKTEMVTGKNQLGQPTSQIRPIQGLAESVTEKVFGQQPLGSSSTYNVGAYYDQLLKMPPQQATQEFERIVKTNPELAKKINQIVKERKAGITVEDQVMKTRGVASGDRAIAISKEFSKLKTPQEKTALWNDYVRKGIITADVAKQLKTMLGVQ
jgi:hypothetical protein